MTEDQGSIPTPPYAPFPSFEDFATGDFDLSNVDQFVGVLGIAKAEASEEQMKQAVDTATRWAAVDTGAIEGLYDVNRGFTFSVASEAAAWDNMHLTVGEDASRAINDALNGYDYVLDIVTEARPITEMWIKELHQIICASQEVYQVLTSAGMQDHPLPRGEYKKYPNNPYNLKAQQIHAYAPVESTLPEMGRLVKELKSSEFANAHPVVQASYVHYAFVCIHPFADGNGRVSRALASIFLYRSPGVPLVIFADQKGEYLDTLEAADAGNFQPFVRFVSDRAIDVVRMVARDMRRKPRPDPAARMEDLKRALLGRGGFPHEEVDAMAGQLFDAWQGSLDSALEKFPVEPPLNIEVVSQRHAQVGLGNHKRDYRLPPDPRMLRLKATASGYAASEVVHAFGTAVAKGEAELADFIVLDELGEVVEEALLRDLTPSVSPSLVYRLDIAAEERVLAIIDQIAAAAESALKKKGYRD